MPEEVLVSIPRDTVNDETVRILSWKVPSGLLVHEEQLICEIETSKAVLEVHAPAAGRLHYDRAAGEDAPVGATLCWITPANATIDESSSQATEIKAAIAETGPEAKIEKLGPPRLTASARIAAAEYNVDTTSFEPGMLVRREDILRAAGQLPAKTTASPNALARDVPVTWVDLPRRKLAERRILRRGRALSVQSCVTSECNVTKLSARLNALGLERIGIQAAVIHGAARLLKKYPVFNAMYHRKRMGQYCQVNIGWALDWGQGLMVPIIHAADTKTVREIHETIQRQMDAYLEGSLSARDLVGATFTVSDLSSQAVTSFEPLIPHGQSAILGISRRQAREGEIVLCFTLAFDHQLSEGKKAAEFLQDLSGRLQSHSDADLPEISAYSEPVAHCVICQRDSATLRRLKVVLLKSEIPPGFVCSLCVGGW